MVHPQLALKLTSWVPAIELIKGDSSIVGDGPAPITVHCSMVSGTARDDTCLGRTNRTCGSGGSGGSGAARASCSRSIIRNANCSRICLVQAVVQPRIAVGTNPGVPCGQVVGCDVEVGSYVITHIILRLPSEFRSSLTLAKAGLTTRIGAHNLGITGAARNRSRVHVSDIKTPAINICVLCVGVSLESVVVNR